MHAFFMHRCLELAERGRGRVSPNPLVGCVMIDASDNVLSEAWHEEFGGKHAEVTAIAAAMAEIRNPKSEIRKNKELTLYVSLEPCCHHGKTPPCTEAITAAGIKTVVFGARDPLHGGASILRQHGIEVIGPVLEAECRRLNRGFFSIVEQGRPWVTLKKALRRDGTVPSEHVTSEEQDQWVHTRLRSTHDAILVGSGTILADDPSLTVRFQKTTQSTGTNFQYVNILKVNTDRPIFQPRRVILDPHSEIPETARVLTDEHASRTITIREKLPIPALLERLKAEGITSVLVEGGPRVWKSFEESNCVDEVVVIKGTGTISKIKNVL